MGKPLILLDRDGVLNRLVVDPEHGTVDSPLHPSQVEMVAGAAEGLRRRVGLRAWPNLRRGETELVAKAREVLGADRFGEVFAAGARLNQRQAVAAVEGATSSVCSSGEAVEG